MADMPAHVREVLNTLEGGGYQAWLVGGCLRDMLLGRAIHDWDVATSALASNVAALFPKTIETGARFGTVTVVTSGGAVEVTTLRRDGTYSDKRRPDEVLFVDDLLEDLKRRDFTINAMAMTAAGQLSDPFDGRGDLTRRLIRCVGRAEDRFSEDALRMFRALRFSAQLGFDIEEDTMKAIAACAPLCAALSAERVRDETEKMLLSDRPGLIGTAVEYGLFNGRLNRQGALPDCLRRIAGLPLERQLRWAALCAVLQHSGFILSGRAFLSAMRLDNETVRNSAAGTDVVLKGYPSDRLDLKRLLSGLGTDAVRSAAAANDVLYGGNALDFVNDVISSGECFTLAELAISGDDLIALGAMPGKQLGEALKRLLDHVIDHPEDNKRAFLIGFAAKTMEKAVN